MLQVVEKGLGSRVDRGRGAEGDDARRGPRGDLLRGRPRRRAAERKEEKERGEKRPAGPARGRRTKTGGRLPARLFSGLAFSDAPHSQWSDDMHQKPTMNPNWNLRGCVIRQSGVPKVGFGPAGSFEARMNPSKQP